mgnify:CR=1 FL=1
MAEPGKQGGDPQGAIRAERRTFRREPAPCRREALMQAALEMIAEAGVEGATVRAIAGRAQVTQGLIRHYFRSKDELILAAYDHHMTRMTGASFAAAGDETDGPAAGAGTTGAPARARLARFVAASLGPPVAAPAAVTLWAGFIARLGHDPGMRAIHARTYHDFRDRLERLIAAALAEAGRPADTQATRRLAIACNGVIDGLWLEGGALPEAFAPGELPAVGCGAVGAILGLDLSGRAATEAARKRKTS